jgi:hypothetical protein
VETGRTKIVSRFSGGSAARIFDSRSRRARTQIHRRSAVERIPRQRINFRLYRVIRTILRNRS